MNEHATPKVRQLTQAAEGLPRWRWTLEEFERLGELGFLTEQDRVELVGGEIVPMSPKVNRHETLRMMLNHVLRQRVSNDIFILPEPGWRPDDAHYFEPDFPARPVHETTAANAGFRCTAAN